MTHECEWDPSTVRLAAVRTVEEEVFRRIAAIARNPPPCVYESDSALTDCSPVYVERSFTERLIASVNIKRGNVTSPLPPEIVLPSDHFEKRWIKGVASESRHSVVSPEHVARTWGIGIETAKNIIKVTTQRGVRHVMHPLHRRYGVDNIHLHRKRLNSPFYTDHMVAAVKSLEGNNGLHVYTNGKFTQVYPTESRDKAGQALKEFTDSIGITLKLTTDLAGEHTGKNTEFYRESKKLRIEVSYSEKGRSNQNHYAEAEIGYLKKPWKQKMRRKDASIRLWYRCFVHQAEIISRTSRGPSRRTGYEELTGETPDISE